MGNEGEGKGNGTVLTREYVPEDLRDRAYLKEYLDKPFDKETATAIFKKLDGAESLIGKRPAIPARDAKPEELDKFFEQFRADKPEDYEVPVEKDAKVDPTFLKAVQDAFHAGKISKVQAQGFLKKITEYGQANKKLAADAQAKKAAEFDTLAKTMLGEQNKVVMERVKKVMAEHAPSVAKENLSKLDDNNLVLMASIIDSVLRKYMPEDELNGKGKSGSGSGSGSGAGDVKSKREEMRKLMTSKAFSNWQDAEHESTNAKVKQLAKEISELM